MDCAVCGRLAGTCGCDYMIKHYGVEMAIKFASAVEKVPENAGLYRSSTENDDELLKK